jgi:putative transposase
MWALAQQPGRKLTSAVFRRKEGAMAKFRDLRTLQKFAAVHASNHNHFPQDRHLNRRDVFKQKRSVGLAEWRQLAA